MRALAALLLLGLAACASGGGKLSAVEVKIPVTRACVPADTPTAPASYPDDGALDPAVAPHERYQRIDAANEARKARLALVEPIIAGCR